MADKPENHEIECPHCGGKFVTVSLNGETYLAKKIDEIIDYTRKEFDMTYCQVIGTLQSKIIEMYNEAVEE